MNPLIPRIIDILMNQDMADGEIVLILWTVIGFVALVVVNLSKVN
jgi:hypothetical protein